MPWSSPLPMAPMIWYSGYDSFSPSQNWERGTYKGAAQTNPADFEAPWFYAAKITGLGGVIAVSVLSICQTLGLV